MEISQPHFGVIRQKEILLLGKFMNNICTCIKLRQDQKFLFFAT